MTNVNTVLFDLDGTLVDSNEIIIASYAHAYESHLPELGIERATIIEEIGPPLADTFAKHTDDPGMIRALTTTYLTHYRKHEKSYFRLYDGVLEVLGQLKERGMNLGIVTSKFKQAAWPSITHFALERFFDIIVTLDDVERPKPAPDGLLKALGSFDNVEGALFVGDNEGDILAGKNAGILSAGVRWSIKGKDELNKQAPDYMIDRMEDILTIIQRRKRRS